MNRHADDTDSSDSGCQLSSDDDEDAYDGVADFKRTRSSVRWRWHWLQLKIAETRHALGGSREVYKRKRRNKGSLLSRGKYERGEHCLRTFGIAKPRRQRKVLTVKPQPVSKALKQKLASATRGAAQSGDAFIDVVSCGDAPAQPPPEDASSEEASAGGVGGAGTASSVAADNRDKGRSSTRIRLRRSTTADKDQGDGDDSKEDKAAMFDGVSFWNDVGNGMRAAARHSGADYEVRERRGTA